MFCRLDPAGPLPRELLEAARRFELPRLEKMCQRALLVGMGAEAALVGGSDEDDEDDEDDEASDSDDGSDSDGSDGARPAERAAAAARALVVPASTLGYDLGGALGDTLWADLRFSFPQRGGAEGGAGSSYGGAGAGGAATRPIYAHRCLLAARADYFKRMFSSGMREGDGALAEGGGSQALAHAGKGRRLVEIEVGGRMGGWECVLVCVDVCVGGVSVCVR